ncbi:MAG: hypothetical protein ACI9YT_000467, partial [Halobacteriales archaeon]
VSGDHDDALQFLGTVEFREELRDDPFADVRVAGAAAAPGGDRGIFPAGAKAITGFSVVDFSINIGKISINN